MVSYEETYRSYVRFCTMIGSPSFSFEDWMHKREDEGNTTPAQRTKEFLDTQVHAGAGAV